MRREDADPQHPRPLVQTIEVVNRPIHHAEGLGLLYRARVDAADDGVRLASENTDMAMLRRIEIVR